MTRNPCYFAKHPSSQTHPHRVKYHPIISPVRPDSTWSNEYALLLVHATHPPNDRLGVRASLVGKRSHVSGSTPDPRRKRLAGWYHDTHGCMGRSLDVAQVWSHSHICIWLWMRLCAKWSALGLYAHYPCPHIVNVLYYFEIRNSCVTLLFSRFNHH